MGKRSRSKKKKQEKQRRDPVDNDNPTNNTSISSSLSTDVSPQIVPPFIYTWKHDQEKAYNHVNNPKTPSNYNMDPNDFISRLPDNILHHIISLLPFESAVRTSFLSTHWKPLWREALLDSVHDVITMEDGIKSVQCFLNGFNAHHRSRNKWGFVFEFSHGRDILVACVSSKRALQLDFSAGKQELPRPFDLLLELNLASTISIYYRYLEENYPLQTKQPCLTMKVESLYLTSVSHLSNMAVSSLVPNLPFLKSLTISKCNGLQSLEIKKSEGLCKLVVLDCPHLQSLTFEGFRLNSFRYRGNLVSFHFRVSSAYNYVSPFGTFHWGLFMEDAMVDLRLGPLTKWTWDIPLFSPDYYGLRNEREHCSCADKSKCFNSILRSIKVVESLTMCGWFYEMSTCEMLLCSSGDPEYRLIELKELWWIDYSMERESFNALLCFLKLCPFLQRLYVTIDPKSYKLPGTEKFSALITVPDKLEYLKAVKLEGCADEEKEILMARRLIPLFGEKNPIIISKSHGKRLKHLVKVAMLEKKGRYPYKFKLVENVDENFPDHVHMNL
ncbi:putative F-box family protein [Hibiscus syriacus]|uniref:F-box family protein n=1 Tax=Hibiscus syriacus TaxID=106335 RepID=A0A6A2Y039_HIBSY|nr:F-box protein At2g39490-like [Hibiscus syriacus]KAE8676360.1 putative F-box family protein [Hibiscus syriacus]